MVYRVGLSFCVAASREFFSQQHTIGNNSEEKVFFLFYNRGTI